MSENIERIIYINLDKRKDRLEEINNEIKNFDLEDKTERFSAVYHSVGCVGCSYSHLAVLKLARDRKYKNILILEDDFYFVVSKEEFESNLKLFFDNVKDYDVCMISYYGNRTEEIQEYPFLLKVVEAQTTSGYIVNERYYNTLIDLFEESTKLLESTGEHWIYAVDQIWKKLQPKDKWYCFANRFGKQRNGFSDISQNYCEYDC